MYPTLFTTAGGVGVHTYGLFILLAFCSAFLLAHVRAPRVGIDPDKLVWTYGAAAVGGLIGARLMYAFAVDLDETLSNPASILSMSGFAVYGGVLGGAMAVIATALRVGIPVWKLGDIAAPAVLLAMGIGRLGCFFAGCCHGVPAPAGGTPLLPDGLLHGQLFALDHFPYLTNLVTDGVGRLHGEPLYPTQLWSALGLIALGLLHVAQWRWRLFDGQVLATALITEAPLRAFVEAFRADHRGVLWEMAAPAWAPEWLPGMYRAGADASGTFGLTTAQVVAVGAVLTGVAVAAYRFRRGVAPETPLAQDNEG
jgi:phosphatidylglycerol:prolipoprotein diacylglycerol transferase